MKHKAKKHKGEIEKTHFEPKAARPRKVLAELTRGEMEAIVTGQSLIAHYQTLLRHLDYGRNQREAALKIKYGLPEEFELDVTNGLILAAEKKPPEPEGRPN